MFPIVGKPWKHFSENKCFLSIFCHVSQCGQTRKHFLRETLFPTILMSCTVARILKHRLYITNRANNGSLAGNICKNKEIINDSETEMFLNHPTMDGSFTIHGRTHPDLHREHSLRKDDKFCSHRFSLEVVKDPMFCALLALLGRFGFKYQRIEIVWI